MKIIRCYASSEKAVNAKNVIQDLLVAEIENILNSAKKDAASSSEKTISRSECA